MTTMLNLGSDSADPNDDTMTLDVPSGATVNVAVTGDTVNVWQNGLDGGVTTTITNGNNANITVPSFLTSNSHSTITLTGGNY